MRVLGIESSSSTASVAIVDDDKLIAEYTINNTMKHSKTLMPMLEEMLKRLEIKVDTIELISVSEGPGSFTGLRIGSATAKGIAHGLNLKIASIPTLEVIASQVQVPGARVGVVVYARAREVYFATYDIELKDGHFYPTIVEPIISLEVEDLVSKLQSLNLDSNYFLVGDGVERFEEDFSALNDAIVRLAPIYCSFSAKNVALLGIKRYHDNDVVTCYEQKPYYHKKSQAEREYEERRK